MFRSRRPHTVSPGALVVALAVLGIATAGLASALLALLISAFSDANGCSGPVGGIVLGSPGVGQVVGASEYGGPGDPSSGVVGASGTNLLATPDSYAELGGESFQTATAMGGLPYMTALRISSSGHSAIAYKRDFGLGGGPVAGLPRVIDLWWELAVRLGIPYEHGQWSGPVKVERPPPAGAAGLIGPAAGPAPSLIPPAAASADPATCAPGTPAGVPITSGPSAALLPNGLAAAPAGAPAPVKAMIAAGNQIAGKPYVYGAGHGLPLDGVGPAYDCSSSVEHVLYGGGLLPVTFGGASSQLESFGAAGAGRWVTLYASPAHVFMYVAGLRWDTHNAAGPEDGSSGIGWHPLVRSSAGFVARHPVGL